MKKRLLIVINFLALAVLSDAQVMRPMTIRYNNASVNGNVVFIANNTVTTPLGNTAEVPPGGVSTNNANPAVNIDIDVDVPAHTSKIAFGSVWNYHARNTAPPNDGGGNTWKVPAYALTANWNLGAVPVAGAGKYGYNSGQTTCLPSGLLPICTPAAGAKFISYYFRRTLNFTAAELSTTFSTIMVNMRRNDGIVVYVNGVERIRNNMPAGAVVYGTLASAAIAVGPAENLTHHLSPSYFVAGVNTIAVEVHLRAAASTEMGFDMEILGVDKASTFSSTSANLNLNSCSRVLWAGLYWGGNHQSGVGGDTTWIEREDTIKLKIPGAANYQTVISTQNDYHNSTRVPGLNHAGYFCFADITSLINLTNPNGTYQVGNVVAPVGFPSGGGGWTIVVAYENATEIQRNINVFDGSVVIKIGNPPLYVPVTGFLTPPAGPVSCELGVVAYDGDRALLDSFLFKQNSNPLVGVYTNLTPNATCILNDMFNSTISNKGVVAAARNPAHNNTLGYDADIIEIPNAGNVLLGNSQSSASIKFSSPVEDFFVQVITASISIYNPTFAFDKTTTDINGGTPLPGDSLRYQVNYTNVGNDASTNTYIVDNIPPGTTYIPGSLRINGVAKTDASGDDQAEYEVVNNRVIFRIGAGANAVVGGTVSTASSGNIQFDVIMASSCKVLLCVDSIQNIARINFQGQTSGASLFDSSGVNIAGCIVQGAVTLTPDVPCFNPIDTLLINGCINTTVYIPWRKYAGYIIYSAQPFVPANIYNTAIPVSASHVYWAYFTDALGCADTIRIIAILTPCPDIDDDNDGITDYVEFNSILATQDANTNGIPNWNDPTYPGFVDNNSDNFNDNFDWGADTDSDGIFNFLDTGFWIAFVDVNGDGINDNSDRDLDGLPNQYDLDCDNDGIPDVVESYGVDANGDGRIDNFTDTDADGLSQNVDANNTGVNGSGVGLGSLDVDADGIANYLDADSDNDGIPDVVEAAGTDANNDGVIDLLSEMDGDGYLDAVDGDVGNDAVAENAANTLLRSGADSGPVDGRADSYPYDNFDNDKRPNPYDVDSDMDGIIDVIDAGFGDADFNGFIDGATGADGWNAAVNAMPSLILTNTDTRGRPDYIDIDSDDDGIPDNIEGQTTASYLLPSYLDNDNDGLDNSYDNIVGFGGRGVFLSDKDIDAIPDYMDLDTDSDGQPDIIEGNDFNLNTIVDDDVTLTLLDTDGDGLDNKFDSLNSVLNIRGTSYRMGNGGSFIGDATPGSRTVVQRIGPPGTDRDWRSASYVLDVELLNFSGTVQNNMVFLDWGVITPSPIDRFEIERSINNTNFIKIGSVTDQVNLNQPQHFYANDDISSISNKFIYYKLKVIGSNGQFKYSNVVVIRQSVSVLPVTVFPNPAYDKFTVRFLSERGGEVTIRLFDNTGKIVMAKQQIAKKGINEIVTTNLSQYTMGVYSLQFTQPGENATIKLIIQYRN